MGINFLDQYSLLHFATGVIAYFCGMSFEGWILLHTSFEIIENTAIGMAFINNNLKDVWPGGKNYADSFINSVGDIIFSLLGWLMAKWLDDFGELHNLYPKHINT